MMLYTKYQGSKPYGFRQEDFFDVFPIISQCKIFAPGRGQFWPQGHNHKVMQHTKYHGSRPNGFRKDDFFHVFSLSKPM